MQEIHSANITDEDRQKTLAPFELSGVSQVGRDYEAFFRNESAWGSHPQSQTEGTKAAEFQATPDLFKKPQPHRSKEPSIETEEKVAATRPSPPVQRKHKKLPLLPPPPNPLLLSPPDHTPSPAAKNHSPLPGKRQPVHPPLAKKPSAPTTAPKPHHVHQKLQVSSSVDPSQIPGRRTKGKWGQRSRGEVEVEVEVRRKKIGVVIELQ